MKCPKCGSNVRCVDARHTPENLTRRRRQCESCGYRFTTIEITAEEYKTNEAKLAILQTLLKAVENEFHIEIS